MNGPRTQLSPVTGAEAWRADARGKESFVVELSPAHLAALERALARVLRQGKDLYEITRADFDLPDMAGDLERWREGVLRGPGLLILRGLPVARYSESDIGTLFWGLGTHFGEAMSQSVMGDRLGQVVGVGGKDARERAYRNSTELAMHTDACDVVAMLCLRKALRGGDSAYVSAGAIYNELLARRPDLLAVLMHGFRYHRFGEELPGEPPVTEERIPVFSFCEGLLSTTYLRAYIEMAAEELAEPLAADERAALDLMDEIAHRPDCALTFMTEPGEAVFFNNLTVLHRRLAFDDSPDPHLRRHLLRLWLVTEPRRPVLGALRRYEAEGIAEQPGRSTYFAGRVECREQVGPAGGDDESG